MRSYPTLYNCPVNYADPGVFFGSPIILIDEPRLSGFPQKKLDKFHTSHPSVNVDEGRHR